MARGYTHRLTSLEVGLVKSAYREGQSITEIAEALNRTRAVIARIIRNAGMSRRRGPIAGTVAKKPFISRTELHKLRVALINQKESADA